MNKTVLYTKNLSVGYNRKSVIDDINISVEAGQIVTLIGSNGSGKSTILKTLAGQLKEISGDIYIKDINLKKLNRKQIAKSVSIMTTDRIEPELMTCRDIVEYGRFPYTGQSGRLSDYDRMKVDEAIMLVNAGKISDMNFCHISDGQKQRILLARAVCQQPDILILDEPTSFLDIKYKLELLNILENLAHEKNIAIIMSLHELDFVRHISDYVLCIKNGRADRYDIPEKIFSDNYISSLYDIKSDSWNIMQKFTEK